MQRIVADDWRRKAVPVIAIVSLLAAVVGWAYWSTLTDLYKDWQRSEDYSAGQLVPFVVLFLLWRQRKALAQCALRPAWLAGGTLLLAALAAQVYGLLFMFESGRRYAFVLAVVALVLLVAGWQVLRRLIWVLLILFLMVPLPGRVHNMISGPLQTMASNGSVFMLEAFGVRVSQQGNIVTLAGRIPMAVAEACSGLRMLTAFVIVAAFIAAMVNRPRWQKITLFLSSIPVAVAANIVRLTATAVLFMLASSEFAERFFHDFAGLVMMPIAVLLMFGELWLMDLLTVSESDPSQDSKTAESPVIVAARGRAKAGQRG